MAKEGYVNLMPANHKRSKDPGDNKEMMQARRRFLAFGHYEPLAKRIAQVCASELNNKDNPLLDIGCGEGYYTHQVQQKLVDTSASSNVFGLDISKIAVKYAAKRYPDCRFAVASSHRLPFAAHSLSAILRIYAPCKSSELVRCIEPGGALITVTPAARHLFQLKSLIYQDVKQHDMTPETLPEFELELEENIQYPMTLRDGSALDLLQMTPFAWKASEELKQELEQTHQFDCEADFMLRVYRKHSD